MDLFDAGNHDNIEPAGKERESRRQEKQIPVDPISLRQEPAFCGSKPMPPIKTGGWHGLLPPLSPAKSKLLSNSLPNSAASSPRFLSVSNLVKRNKKWMRQENRAGAHAPPRQDFDRLTTLGPYLAMQQDMRSFRRSKSCGEGRAIPPSVDFDLLSTQAKATGTATSPSDSSCTGDSSESECRQDVNLKKKNFPGMASHKDGDREREKESRQEEFKCGALCLFLQGFGKPKPVKSKRGSLQAVENSFVISRTVSLEKFECGSWASPAINANEIIGHEDGAGAGAGIGDSANHLYFDLPLEMIRSSANDTHSPVTAAFILDKERKGVLKKSSSARKLHGSSRHVRFSTSSPGSHPTSPTSCITPRLRKAREDFNAFLEAQSA